ncbi:MAG: hypothetical protein OXS35_09630 [Dehalococcoidia bacterium]|nr:hypothetical protein [Dehalococcoidia bacterium]
MVSMFQKAVRHQNLPEFEQESLKYLQRLGPAGLRDSELVALRECLMVGFREEVRGHLKARDVGVDVDVRLGGYDHRLKVKVDPDVGIVTGLGQRVLKLWIEEERMLADQAVVCHYLMRQGSERSLWGDAQTGVWGILSKEIWLTPPPSLPDNAKSIVKKGAEDFIVKYDEVRSQRRLGDDSAGDAW